MLSETCLHIQAALFYVLKESFKVYKAVSEGLINLADKFFDMDYFNAQRALEIYKESILSAERLQVPCCKKLLCCHICRDDCSTCRMLSRSDHSACQACWAVIVKHIVPLISPFSSFVLLSAGDVSGFREHG